MNCLIKLNSNIILSNTSDHNIKIWDFKTGDCLKTIKIIGFMSKIRCLFKINENVIVSGNNDHNIKIWNLSSENLIRTLKGHLSIVSCLLKKCK